MNYSLPSESPDVGEIEVRIPLLAEEGGAKREPDRAKPQLTVSSAQTFRHSDHPVCAFALLGASTPPLRGGDWRLLLDVPLQCHTAGQRSVDISLGVGRNAFLRAIGVWIRNGG